MGRIVKSNSGATPTLAVPTSAGAEDVAAVLAAARVEAKREWDRAKDAAVVLARKMAEKIVGHAIEVEPEVMVAIAGRALAAAKPGREAALLRVHPEDLALLESCRSAWLAELGAEADVRMVADGAVGRHGCVVETAVGRLDARLQTQLDALEHALRGAGIGRVRKE
jgi:flagellar biosynthesis/type III secretory pathway protein FliH